MEYRVFRKVDVMEITKLIKIFVDRRNRTFEKNLIRSSKTMSCQPCASRDFLPRCAIYSILSRLVCSLCGACRHKQRKFEDFKCAVRLISRFSVDPRGGYAVFIGLRDNDPTKFAALYIDNIRGEFDPNIGAHRIYHVAFCVYGDTNAICRSLQQRHTVIAGNADEFTGENLIAGAVSQKVFRSQPNNVQPIGITMPFAGNVVGVVPGSPADIFEGDEYRVGFEG